MNFFKLFCVKNHRQYACLLKNEQNLRVLLLKRTFSLIGTYSRESTIYTTYELLFHTCERNGCSDIDWTATMDYGLKTSLGKVWERVDNQG